MTTYTTETRVSQFVTDNPDTSRIFQRYGIDFCCGGKKPLGEVCAAKGLDAGAVLAELVADKTSAAARDWGKASLTELADHIETTHHAYLREEMPRLTAMIEKVAQVHGERHPKLWRVRQVFAAVRSELESHMFKEEQILFPAIRRIEAGEGAAASHCGSVANPIRVMEHEHDSAGEAVARMRELTGGYQAPEDACNTYRAMLAGLVQFETDLHLHVHKENNILFPRAMELESELAGARA